MTLRIGVEETQRLRDRAQADGVSMQDVALTAIRNYLDGRTRADVVNEALTNTLSRYPSTLIRLVE